ncbi:UNVERIFIED_CONTAM: hypothetical protein Sindi_2031100 [Sesamum indicum]
MIRVLTSGPLEIRNLCLLVKISHSIPSHHYLGCEINTPIPAPPLIAQTPWTISLGASGFAAGGENGGWRAALGRGILVLRGWAVKCLKKIVRKEERGEEKDGGVLKE